MRQRLADAALIFGIWTLLGVYTAHQLYFSRASNQVITWSYALSHQLSYSYLWALQTPLIIWLARRLPVTRGRYTLSILVHIGASLLFSFPPRIAQQIWLAASGFSKTLVLDPMSRFGSLGLIDYGVVFYWAILLFAHLRAYSEREHASRLKASQLETELAKAQLQALRLQLNPHFLFNSLNAIVELIHEDPKSAERIVTRLGELLRTCLSSSSSQEIPLRQEVDFVRQYAEIEATRFDDHLTITFSIDEPTLNTLVPNFILQPLVENAIKHGFRGRDTRSTVLIESEFQDGWLRLRVADNGSGIPKGEISRNGTGLANTRNRLERLYGNSYEFVARNQVSGGFESIVLIPCRNAS